jgi:hypothetical protein
LFYVVNATLPDTLSASLNQKVNKKMNNLQYKEEAGEVNYKEAAHHNNKNDNRNPMKMFEAFQAYNPNSIFDLFQNEKLQLNQSEFLIALNQQISNIQSIISTSGTVYFWDLLYPMYRSYFLKRVNYSLPINSSLSWNSLPVSVQNNLINFDYNFKKNPNLNSISAQIKASLSLFSLNSLIDVNVLKQKLNAIFDSFIDEGISMMQNAVYEKRTSSGSCIRGKKVKRSDDTNDINNNDEEQEQEQEGDFEHFSPKSQDSFDSYTPPPNSEHLEERRKRSNQNKNNHKNNNNNKNGNNKRKNVTSLATKTKHAKASNNETSVEQESEGTFSRFTPPENMQVRRKRSNNKDTHNNNKGNNQKNNASKNKHGKAKKNEKFDEQSVASIFSNFNKLENTNNLHLRRRRSNNNNNNKNAKNENHPLKNSTKINGKYNNETDDYAKKPPGLNKKNETDGYSRESMDQSKHNETLDNETSDEQENEGSFDRFTPPPNRKHLELRRKRSNQNKNGDNRNRNPKNLASNRGEHGHKGSSKVSHGSRPSKRSTIKNA